MVVFKSTSKLILLLGVAGLCHGDLAAAQDLPPPRDGQATGASRDQYAEVDGSAVATSLGDRSIDINATFALVGDISESGARLRLSGNASWYRFVTDPDTRLLAHGYTLEGGLLAGYQFSLSRVNFIAMIGPTIASGEDAGVRSSNWGVKSILSMYARPTDWTMAYGSISYSTSGDFVQLQTKVGAKLVGNFYIGPEATFSWRDVLPALDNAASMRAGAHISAIALGQVQVGFSGGWAWARDLGSGYYGGLNFYFTF